MRIATTKPNRLNAMTEIAAPCSRPFPKFDMFNSAGLGGRGVGVARIGVRVTVGVGGGGLPGAGVAVGGCGVGVSVSTAV